MKAHTKGRMRSAPSVLFSLLSFLFLLMPSFQAAPSQWIRQGNTTQRVVALTFDDGSDGTYVNNILSTLQQHNIKATFFLTGSGAEDHPQSIINVVNAGHDIGNHSYNHPHFPQVSVAEIQSQMNRTETIIRNLTGKSTLPFFRAPYGETNATVLNTVGDLGYTYTLHWTIDSLDWTGNSADDIYNRVINNMAPGAIVLMHAGVGATNTVTALNRIIPQLKNMGYSFVTISQLLNTASNPSTPGSGTTYTVQPGDTLYAIALRYGTTVQAIASANGITNPSLIRVGQTLTIPGTSGSPTTPPPATGTSYTVQAGDTLYAIANRYGTTVQAIASANGISNPSLIRVGQVLRIPGTSGGPVTPPPPTESILYTVQPGDTLYAIANRYGTTVQAIASANGITDPNLIRVTQVLRILLPASGGGTATTYTVQAGDTLYSIALRYGRSVQSIASANGITNPNLIRVGQVLTIR